MSPAGNPRRALSSPSTTSATLSRSPDSKGVPKQLESDGNDSSIRQPSPAKIEAKDSLVSYVLVQRRSLIADTSYITLTVSRPQSTYVTTILLGNDRPSVVPVSAPTTTTISVWWTPYTPSTALSIVYSRSPATPRTAVIGIIVGCVLSLFLLLGVLWVYWLRLHQMKRNRARTRSRKSSSAGSAPPPPPDPPGPA